MSNKLTRRSALKMAGGAAAAALAGTHVHASRAAAPLRLKGNINHSACKWCYPNQTLEELAAAAREIGLKSIELLEPKDFPTLEKHGLVCAMVTGPGGITKGWNRVENHEWLIPGFEERLRETAEAGYPSVIAFSGNREGLSDAQGLENCVVGLKKLMPTAERYGVNVVMELLNSKVNHPDYMCDRTAWGVELVKRVGSERFKLLYDIYHMQIMEGDVIRTIREAHPYIAHYHTGGNPGRNEIDETQELYYPAIMQAIKETGYTGYVGQEFIPKHEPLASLREAVAICDV